MDLVCDATDTIRKLGKVRADPVSVFVAAVFDRPAIVDYEALEAFLREEYEIYC
jgi:hypothetical protein